MSAPKRPATHDPEILVYGPCVEHSQSCPVFHGSPAVLDMTRWVFQPSWKAQELGWRLVRATTWWHKLALRMIDKAEREAG